MNGHHPQTLIASQNEFLWTIEADNWNDLHLRALNIERDKIGLSAIDDVLSHVFSVPILLAADSALVQPGHQIVEGMSVIQSADWIVPDSRELSEDVLRFLDAGEPPMFFGCGSMRANINASRMFIEAARSLGKRAILSQGWSNLQPIDNGDDCLFCE